MERRHAPEAGEQEEASPHTPLASLFPPEARVVSIREAGVLTFLKHCFDLPGKFRKVKGVREGHNRALLHIPLIRPVKGTWLRPAGNLILYSVQLLRTDHVLM